MNTMKKCSTCGSLYEGDLCPKCMAGFAQQRTTPATAPPVEELPLKPGQTFHGLEIVELLGRGGMGVVYKARQPGLDRLVALKILPQRLALDPDFQGRFAREAKALGTLSHPNIVAVHDFGAEAGLFYFVMEFVDGVNLRELLRQGKIAPEQALKIVPQLCDALEFAHGEGVVHRDIKPENILMDKRGRVKIADFGLAKLTGADVPVQLTQTNMVMGTPHYMAPEQVENPKAVDHRADIYSMGVVLYEMLTGELPIGKFEPPSKRVEVDVRLDEVVLKALEKQPDRRYQKASDVKEGVTRLTAGPQPASAGPARWVYCLAALAIVASAVPLAILFSKAPPPPPTATATVPPAPEPVDLSKIYFGQEERPADWRLSNAPATLGRNPLPAKTPEDLDRLVKQLDNEGLQNVTRADIKEGYYALWGFRGGCALIALDTSIAERLERDFQAIKSCAHRWSHRKGSLLVLAMAGPRENRAVFADLVRILQKKLGLSEETPDLPLANLDFDKSDAPAGLILEGGRTELASTFFGKFRQQFVTEKGDPVVDYAATRTNTLKEAVDAEAELRAESPSSEVLRAGRTVTALALRTKNIGAFEKLAHKLRTWMGYPARTFETIRPVAAELPEGYAFEKTLDDPKAVLDELKLEGVKPEELKKAFRATLKPAGALTLLEIEDSSLRSKVEFQLDSRGGAAEDSSPWLFAVEGPDDPALDTLESFMRAKFGWDPNRPRALQFSAVRLDADDVPAGWTHTPKEDIAGIVGTLQGQGGVIVTYRLLNRGKFAGTKPGDVELEKDDVYFHATGPEAAWHVLDQLDALFRKKMRLGPPKIEDILRGGYLPEGTRERKESNYLSLVHKDSMAAGWEGWEGAIGAGVVAAIFELNDPSNVPFVKKALEITFKDEIRAAVYAKAPFVAFVKEMKEGTPEGFRKLSEAVRAKLRAPTP